MVVLRPASLDGGSDDLVANMKTGAAAIDLFEIDGGERSRFEKRTGIAGDLAAVEHPSVWAKQNSLGRRGSSSLWSLDVLDEEVGAAWPKNAMGLADDLPGVIDATQQQRADHAVRGCIVDIDRFASERSDLEIDTVLVGASSKRVVHDRVRFDRDDLGARRVVPHVDTGSGAEFHNGAGHCSNRHLFALAVFSMDVGGPGVKDPGLQPASKFVPLEVDHHNMFAR